MPSSTPPRRLGWVKDPLKKPGETPDALAEHVLGAAPLPEEASLEQHVILLDQGPYNSCVANNAAQVIRARHSFLGVRNPRLPSRWWAYYIARASHGDQHRDEGTFVRACFDQLRKYGFPYEELWPYKPMHNGREMWDCMPEVKAFEAASDQRSPLAYYRITQAGAARTLAVKRAIARGFCVEFGCPVSQPFVNGDYGQQFVGLPGPREPIAGGHAMTIAKYDSRGFSGPQTWGEHWGDKGWWHFKTEVIESPDADDFWIAENVPKFMLAP